MRNPAAGRTIGHAHRVLSKVLRRAVENGNLARNVASIRKPPAVELEEVEIPPDQVTAVLEALKGHTLPIVALALATGLRRGELLALRWSFGSKSSCRSFQRHVAHQEYYRGRAEDCCRDAITAESPDRRLHWLEAAARWLTLAP
jgi:integrase